MQMQSYVNPQYDHDAIDHNYLLCLYSMTFESQFFFWIYSSCLVLSLFLYLNTFKKILKKKFLTYLNDIYL